MGRSWKFRSREDRRDASGRLVTVIQLKNAQGLSVDAEVGDFVRILGSSRSAHAVGVIEGFTPQRVRVLVDGRGANNFSEDNLRLERKRPQPTQTRGGGRIDSTTTCSSTPVSCPTLARVAPQASGTPPTVFADPNLNASNPLLPTEPKQTVARLSSEAMNFFIELEEKMLDFTHASVKLFTLMEKGKAKFIHDYPLDGVEEFREEFRAEAERRFNDFADNIRRMEAEMRRRRADALTALSLKESDKTDDNQVGP